MARTNDTTGARPAAKGKRRIRFLAGMVLTGMGLALSTAGPAAAAPLWSSVPSQWPCPGIGSNKCVAHTGFRPDKVVKAPHGYWGMFTNPIGNCTNYVAYRLIRNGAAEPGDLGNAAQWASSVRRALGAARVDGVPAVGAVAWWSGSDPNFGFGGAGHVAYVERVAGGTVYLSDSRWYEPGVSQGGSFRWSVRKGDPRWPDAFLHVKDAPVGASPIGRLEKAQGLEGGRVRVDGWAFDPDAARKPVSIEAWVDGRRGEPGARRVALGPAVLPRGDVARVHRAAGPRHGYSEVISGVEPGTHTVRVYALNRAAGGDVAYLGGKTVKVPVPASNGGDDVVDPLDPPDPATPDTPGTTTPSVPSFVQGEYAWAVGDKYESFMGDFNGDKQVDVGLRRISDGTFYWKLGPGFAQGSHAWTAGAGAEYQSFMGDFNGDNQVDVGLRRISNGMFYWRLGPDFGQSSYMWTEAPGDGFQSFMGDFNGDNQVDVGVRRISTGMFYWRWGPAFTQSSVAWSAGAGAEYQSFMGDWNGDDRVDVGLRRMTNGAFYWRVAPDWLQTRYDWADGAHFQSFMGDFNGDNLVDVGLRRTTDGTFYWRISKP